MTHLKVMFFFLLVCSLSIPFFCLLLLLCPFPLWLDRIASRVVNLLFFTRLSIGPVTVNIAYLFLAVSACTWGNTMRRLYLNQGEDATIYNRATRFKRERDSWIASFALGQVLFSRLLRIGSSGTHLTPRQALAGCARCACVKG